MNPSSGCALAGPLRGNSGRDGRLMIQKGTPRRRSGARLGVALSVVVWSLADPWPGVANYLDRRPMVMDTPGSHAPYPLAQLIMLLARIVVSSPTHRMFTIAVQRWRLSYSKRGHSLSLETTRMCLWRYAARLTRSYRQRWRITALLSVSWSVMT